MRTDDEPINPLAESSPGTAPKVTPADVEANIASEWYINAAHAVRQPAFNPPLPDNPSLALLTICVLVLRNGFSVVGTSACASPENFDAAYGRKLARGKAVEQIWPLLGFQLREKLHQAPAMSAAVAQLSATAEICEANAPLHADDGKPEQEARSRANAASYRAAIAALLP